MRVQKCVIFWSFFLLKFNLPHVPSYLIGHFEQVRVHLKLKNSVRSADFTTKPFSKIYPLKKAVT